MVKEANNMILKEDILLIKDVNVTKDNDLQLIKKVKKNSKIKDSALKSVNCSKDEGEIYEDNLFSVLESKEIKLVDDDFPLAKNESSQLGKKIVLKSLNRLSDVKKDIESKTKLLNTNSVETHSLNEKINDINKFNCCSFCRKKFETLEHLNGHDCRKEKTLSDPEVYNCDFCSLTFNLKLHLNNHIKSHNRHNCTVCMSQFVSYKALCKHLKVEHNITETKNIYHCSFCDERFCRKQLLNIHLKSHLNNQYLCLKCGFICDDETTYKDHAEKHVKTLKYECELCGQKFARSQQHKRHMINHEKYSCSSCNVTFSSKKLFFKHRQSTHNNETSESHECSVCKKIFSRATYLAAHQKIHTRKKSVKCSLCEKSFYDKISLSKHLRSVKHMQRVRHNEGKNIEIEKNYSCSKCSAKFYQLRSLSRHIKYMHSESQLLKCPHCEYNSKIQTNLRRHIATHTDIKHFICDICKASFRTASTLKQHHVFVHSESREFLCKICNKGFKDKSSLQRHMRIHSENRPYKCYCNKDFKRLSHLKRHMILVHHRISQNKQFQVIKENITLNQNVNNGSINLVEALETLSNHSSSDILSESSVDDRLTILINNAVLVELSNSDKNGGENHSKLPDSIETNSSLNPASSTNMKETPIFVQAITNHNDKNISVITDSTPCEETPIILPNFQPSFPFDDPNFTLSPSSFCNFNLPSSPFTSVGSQNMLSLSSSDEASNQPHPLPNSNTVTQISNMDAFTTSDSSCLSENPSFLLTSNILSSSHQTDLNNGKQQFSDSNILSTSPSQKNTLEVKCSLDLNLELNNSSKLHFNDSNFLSSPLSPSTNTLEKARDSLELPLEQNSSSKQLFSDSNLSLPSNVLEEVSNSLDLNLEQNNSSKEPFSDSDFLSLTPSLSNNIFGEVKCPLEPFFSSTSGIELWEPDEDSSLKINYSDLITTSKNDLSINLLSNDNNFLSHNLFSNDSLMVCSFEAASFNSEFEALSNLC